jgi:hypothetical protein
VRSPLVNTYNHPDVASVQATLDEYLPAGITELLVNSETRIIPLPPKITYAAASPALRELRASVDDWPVPPAGLYVVAERTVYLRSLSPMTVIHETMHALDNALGGNCYLSSTEHEIRTAFKDARAFVTPYAASGLDEFFAECGRAYFNANDARSPWPPATPERLRSFSPAMFDFFEATVASLRPKCEAHQHR